MHTIITSYLLIQRYVPNAKQLNNRLISIYAETSIICHIKFENKNTFLLVASIIVEFDVCRYRVTI